jgi:hypothetical protein
MPWGIRSYLILRKDDCYLQMFQDTHIHGAIFTGQEVQEYGRFGATYRYHIQG